jgi:hypothetical protein
MSSFSSTAPVSQKPVAWTAGTDMLDVYLPRVSSNINTEELKHFLREIAIIADVDFVAIKDQETKAIRHYAVYLKLKEWNSLSKAYGDMRSFRSFKLFISPVEYLILLPNKTPLPRSKVNTHQLASFTEELYNKVAALESHCAIQANLINNQGQQINWLMKMATFKKEEEEEEEGYEDTTTVCKRKFDDDKQLGFHETVCLGKEEEVEVVDDNDYTTNEKCIERLKNEEPVVAVTAATVEEEEKHQKKNFPLGWQFGSNGICGNL